MNPITIITILGTLVPAILQGIQLAETTWPNLVALWQELSSINILNLQNDIAFVQALLNAFHVSGTVKLSKPLVVDGKFGGDTFQAIKEFQTQLGITVNEPLASAEMKAIA